MPQDIRTQLEALLAHHEGAATAIRTTLDLLNGHLPVRADPDPSDPVPGYLAARRRTAAILDGLSRTEPRPVVASVGPLVHHGYIKRKGTGYIRTDKPYRVP